LAGITTTGSDSTGRLRRILGLGFGLAVMIGSTIGVGILRTPGLVAGQLHDTSTILVAWVIGGVYTLLGAICLTELGAMAPQAGGYYVYARRAFGDWVGFAVGWTDWLTYCAVLGYVSIGMSEFLAELIPSLAGAVKPIAIGFLVGFVALQWAGVRISSWFQEWTTALKFLAFVALVIAGLALSGMSSSASSIESGTAPGAAPATASATTLTLAGVIAALQAVVITYAGWQSPLYFTEEDRNPTRNLPRAMIGGVLAVIAIYLLVNFALLVILSIAQLAGSKQPAALAAELLVGERGRQIITILSITSLVPLLNAIMMVGTRILFALGRDRLFWSHAADVNAGGTPGIATLVTMAVAIGCIMVASFERLVGLASIFLAINYAVSCLALVALRRREPAATRPFRAWGYPWTAAIVVAGALAFVIGAVFGDSGTIGVAAALLAAGLVGHAWHRRTR
jgi:basic amino acid/polyamine antiporter, APA family